MTKYKYYPEFDEDDCLVWHIYENATNQIIESFLFEEDAIIKSKRFEAGEGFDGFTPAFMLVKVPSVNIDDAFAAEFVG